MSYKMGDAARMSGVNIETIRFYEREGLFPRPPRTTTGRRIFSDDDIKTLRFLRNARELGFGLVEIQGLLALRGPHNECADVKAIAQKRLEAIRAEQARINESERLLSDAIAKCPGGRTNACTLLALLES